MLPGPSVPPSLARLLAGLRDAGPDRPADGLRDAAGSWPVRVVVARPGAQVLLRRALVGRTARCAAGPAGGPAAAASRRRGDRHHRRHAVLPYWKEGVGGRLVPRRVG